MWTLVKCVVVVTALSFAVAPALAGHSSKECIIKILKERLVDFSAARNATDPKALGKIFTENARFLPPNLPIVIGRENIVASLLAIGVRVPKGVAENQVTIVASSSVAMQQNTFVVFDKDDNVVDVGKGISVWILEEDEQWRMVWFVFNSDNPCNCVPQN